jgi:hypothetical protein
VVPLVGIRCGLLRQYGVRAGLDEVQESPGDSVAVVGAEAVGQGSGFLRLGKVPWWISAPAQGLRPLRDADAPELDEDDALEWPGLRGALDLGPHLGGEGAGLLRLDGSFGAAPPRQRPGRAGPPCARLAGDGQRGHR